MIDSKTHMQKVVVACTVSDRGDVHSIGVAEGFYDCPSVFIRRIDGSELCWAQHLCRAATPQEAEAYWRERALAAEAKLNESNPEGGAHA